MAEPTNNRVDRVIVSDATRAMAGGRYVAPSVDAEIDAATTDIEAKNARKRQIETRLSTLNARVISAGRLPRAEYASIVDEQATLKKELGDILGFCANARNKLDKLRASKTGLKNKPRDGEPMAPILHAILEELRAVRQLLEKRAS